MPPECPYDADMSHSAVIWEFQQRNAAIEYQHLNLSDKWSAADKTANKLC